MSDFLARLGARHIAEPAVRPRAASRFEQASALPLDRESIDVYTVPSEQVRRDAVTDATVAPNARGAAQSRSGLPPRTRVADDTTGTFADPSERESSRSDQARSSVAVVADRVSADTRPAAVVESPRSVDGKERRDVAEVVPRTPRSAAPEASTIATRVAARTSMASSSTRSADVSDSAAAAPDVIRVHIGRVEVRAIMPPAERPRPRGSKASEAQGPLSLDRYLSGKGRP